MGSPHRKAALKLMDEKCPKGYIVLREGEMKGYSSMSSVEGQEGEITNRRWGHPISMQMKYRVSAVSLIGASVMLAMATAWADEPDQSRHHQVDAGVQERPCTSVSGDASASIDSMACRWKRRTSPCSSNSSDRLKGATRATCGSPTGRPPPRLLLPRSAGGGAPGPSHGETDGMGAAEFFGARCRGGAGRDRAGVPDVSGRPTGRSRTEQDRAFSVQAQCHARES